MARLQLRRWRLPGTEIDFVQMSGGPRAGEYVVSAETVDRLPEFYAKVANLPYKPDAAKQLNEVFQRFSSGGMSTLYEAFASSPAGLAAIVPPRWMLNLPVWSRVPLAGVSAWQWLGLSIGLLSGVLVIFACHRLARRRVDRGEELPGVSWRALPYPCQSTLSPPSSCPFYARFSASVGPRASSSPSLKRWHFTSVRHGSRSSG